MTTTIVDGLDATKQHYARETDLDYATWAVRLISATMQIPSGSDYARGLFVDLDATKEYTIYERQGGSPAADDPPVRFLSVDLDLLIKAKTDLITSAGQTYVSSADTGMLNVREAYVIAFDRTNGELKTGDAANITAKWKKDDGNAEPLEDTNPTEVEDGVYLFNLTDAERTFSRVAYILPESSTTNIVVRGDPPVYHMIDSLILAKARLIGTAEAALRSPMLESGGFAEPLVIGDDYLESLSRSIEWTVTSAVAPASGKIGFRREGKSRSTSDKFTLSADSEQIEDLGSNRYRIYFDMPRSTTIGKTPDNYEYQLSLFDGSGNKITFYHSHFFAADGTPARNYVTLVESYIE